LALTIRDKDVGEDVDHASVVGEDVDGIGGGRETPRAWRC
jgi:hypothetical protein